MIALGLLVFATVLLVVFSWGLLLLSGLRAATGPLSFYNQKILVVPFCYFLGLRFINAVVFYLGLLGVGFKSAIVTLSVVGICFFIFNVSQLAKSIKDVQSNTGYLGLLYAAVVGVIFLILLVSVFYYPATSWDHFTHWLLVPHEIIQNDITVGLYPHSRSVALEYPAHQSILGAMILSLWQPISYSDVIAESFTPFHLMMAFFVFLSVLRGKVSNWFIVLATATFLLLSNIRGSGSYYLATFYGDALLMSVVTFTVVAAANVFIEAQARRSWLLLAVILSMTLMVKPYAAVLSVVGLFLSLFYLGIRNTVKAGAVAAGLVAVEALQVIFSMYFVPSKGHNVVKRGFGMLAADKWQGNLEFALTFAENTRLYLVIYGVLLLTGIISLAVLFIRRQKSSLAPAESYLSAISQISWLYSIVFFLQLFTLAVVVQALSNSLPRYLSNNIMVIYISVLTGMLFVFSRFKLGQVFATVGLLVIFVFSYRESTFVEHLKTSYQAAVVNKVEPFSQITEFTTSEKILTDIAAYKPQSGRILLLQESGSSYLTWIWSYLVARTNVQMDVLNTIYPGDRANSFYYLRKDIYEGRTSFEKLNEAQIDLVLVATPLKFGNTVVSGLFSPMEFAQLVEGKQLVKEE